MCQHQSQFEYIDFSARSIIAYIILAILLKKQQNWNYPTLAIILAASLIPFGTFYIEKKYCKNV